MTLKAKTAAVPEAVGSALECQASLYQIPSTHILLCFHLHSQSIKAICFNCIPFLKCSLTINHLLENWKITLMFLFCFEDKRTRYFSKKYTWAHSTWSNGLLLRKLWTWKVFWDFSRRIWYSRSNLEQWNEVNNQLVDWFVFYNLVFAAHHLL